MVQDIFRKNSGTLEGDNIARNRFFQAAGYLRKIPAPWKGKF
jgi:hypothetical protein